MNPIRHILVPTDFGEPAQRAVDYAVDLATLLDATVTLLHVYEPPILPYAIGIYLPTEELYGAAKKATHDAAARARARWQKLDAFVAQGSALEQIIRVAKSREADLIVMGTQGHRGVARALLGSVAETVVRLSPVPVLTLHAAASSAVPSKSETPEPVRDTSVEIPPTSSSASSSPASSSSAALKVSDIMSRKVIAVDASSSVRDAAALFVSRGISGVPVLDAGRVVGVLSKTDVVREGPADQKVRAIMTPLIRFVRPQHPAESAVEMMLASKVHRVLVLDDDGCVAGIVTPADILRAQRAGVLRLREPWPHAEAAQAIPDEGGF
jgi:nucleotide-binding universal stress UspA family protein/CBS domain-containing protein